MPSRSLRMKLAASAALLALVATACGGDDSSGSSDTTGGNPAEELGKVDCGQLKYDKDAPTGGTFTDYQWLSSNADNTSFDPAVTQTLSEAQITTAVWDGLTDFDFTEKCSPVLKGAVAEDDWDVNADATEYTFKIKDGQVFSNGEKVLPHNFKQAWERAGSKDVASPYGYLINYIKGGADYAANGGAGLDAIVADDSAMTLKVTLSAPNADFAAILTHQFWSPISDADFAKHPKSAGWGDAGALIGNGPFMVESAPGADKDVTLVPNPKWAGNVYGDKKVHLDKIIFKSTPDVNGAYQTFDAGDGDSAPIPPGQFKAAMAAYPNNSATTPNLGAYYFDFGDVPELAGPENLELRRAISMAIDRTEINDKVYEGTRTIATGIAPPGIPGFKKDLCQYCKTDAVAAKEHLKKWTDAGGKLSGPLKIEYNPGGAHENVAQIIQANIKDVLGLDAQLDPIAQKYFATVAKEGSCHICRSGWYADYPTYGNFMVDLFSAASIGGNNFARYNSPDFEAKIAAAQAETDATKRGELYQQAEEILLNTDTVAIPLNWYTGSAVFRDNVVNNDQPPLGLMLWERIAKTS